MNFNNQEDNINVLEKYGRDITDSVKKNKIVPLFGFILLSSVCCLYAIACNSSPCRN